MIKIKKCKKLKCSEIKIYSSESDLVKEYNQNLKPPQNTSNTRKELTEVDKQNIIYIKSINEINSKIFHSYYRKRSAIQYPKLVLEIVKTLIYRRHKNKKLSKNSINSIFKKINQLQLVELMTIKNLLTVNSGGLMN